MKNLGKIMVLIMVSAMLFSSCQWTGKPNTHKLERNIEYFKDEETGLCYAAVNSIQADGLANSSIACVPCDSLKNVKVK
ncbi:MAG: hypothetical protein WC333_00135 [Dehalococcoidia bacterium]|jgi:hypothetical protein